MSAILEELLQNKVKNRETQHYFNALLSNVKCGFHHRVHLHAPVEELVHHKLPSNHNGSYRANTSICILHFLWPGCFSLCWVFLFFFFFTISEFKYVIYLLPSIENR